MKYAKVFLVLIIWSSTQVLADADFKVGILISLSGHGIEYGKAIQNGASLALEDNKGEQGFCDFIYEDSEYNTSKTVTAFHKMAIEGINLVYLFGGPMAEALAPLAESKKVPLICDSIDPKITVGREFVVRHANTPTDYGSVVSDYLIKKGKKKVGIVKSENQFLNSLVSGLIDSSRGQLDPVIVGSISAEDNDFKPILPKLLRGNFDAIGLFMFPGQLSSLAKLFKGRESKFTFIGAEVMESKQEIKASLGVLEGAVYPNNLVNEKFKERYIEKFKNDSQIKFAGEGYDVMTLILNSICKRTSIPSGQETMALLKAVRVRDGVLGKTEYVETAEGDKYFKAPVYAMKASVNGFQPVDLEGSKQ